MTRLMLAAILAVLVLACGHPYSGAQRVLVSNGYPRGCPYAGSDGGWAAHKSDAWVIATRADSLRAVRYVKSLRAEGWPGSLMIQNIGDSVTWRAHEDTVWETKWTVIEAAK